MNFILNKSLKYGTFPCCKHFHMPYRTRDMKFKTSCREIFKGLSHVCLLPLLQFACKNWISTSASIDAQFRYNGTTLFYVNLPRLRMVLDWRMFLWDQIQAALPKFIAWQASAVRGCWTHWTCDQLKVSWLPLAALSYSCDVNFCYI